MKYFLFIVFLLSIFLNTSQKEYAFEEQSVAAVMKRLGDQSIKHYPHFGIRNVSVENGRRLFHTGFSTKAGGGRSKKQSKHFVCTSCHNVAQEDPDLSSPNPTDRLLYAKEKGIPFLQGTTMYGAVNRTNFYNGDYYKKYGDLVIKARKNIHEAIQLCAVECAQGRKLKKWEIESIIAYLWTLELQMKDLPLTDTEKETIQKAYDKEIPTEEVIALLKTKYPNASQATFIPPPENRKKGEAYHGDPENGKLVYELSCKHCHENERYSFYALDNSKTTFQHLKKHIPKYTRYSLYQVTRWGTEPIPGKGAYMPHYTEERMSRQQLQDLRAYIEREAE